MNVKITPRVLCPASVPTIRNRIEKSKRELDLANGCSVCVCAVTDCPVHATNQGWIDKDHTITQGAGMRVALICNENNRLQQFIQQEN